MANLFDNAVSFLGRGTSLDALVQRASASSEKSAQLGVVLSAPVVIAGLDRSVDDPDGFRSLGSQLGTVSPMAAESFVELARANNVDELGGAVLDAAVGPSRDGIVERIAQRAGLDEASASSVLTATAATIGVHLVQRFGPALDREVLADASQALVADGWEPWIEETLGPVPPEAPIGDDIEDELDHEIEDQIEEDVDDAVPGTGLSGPARSSFPAPVTARSAAAAGGLAVVEDVARPTPASQRRVAASSRDQREDRSAPPESGRSPALLMLAGLVFLATLIALLAFLFGGGDDESETQAGEDASPTSDVIAEETSDQDPDGAAGSSTTAADPGATAEPETVRLAVDLDDPLEVTEGTGTADLTLDPVTGQVCFDFAVDGVGNPYDGHVHVGPKGVKGGIVIDFGELRDAPMGCLDLNPVDVTAIVNDLGGHYVEFHDPDDVSTVRAQLSELPRGAEAEVAAETEGAVVVIEDGALRLQGEVPDQVSVDKFIETFADIDLGTTELVNELTIVPGAPRPSGRILVDDAILFDVDSDELAETDGSALDDLVTIFTARPAWTLTVIGYTDNTGPEVYNLELSLRRASAVRDALVAAGVAPGAVAIEGAGATAPIATNDTPAGRAQNRRIEFVVVPG